VRGNQNDLVKATADGSTLQLVLSFSEHLDFRFPTYEEIYNRIATSYFQFDDKDYAEGVMFHKFKTNGKREIPIGGTSTTFTANVEINHKEIKDFFANNGEQIAIRALLVGMIDFSTIQLQVNADSVSANNQAIAITGSNDLQSQPYLLCVVLDEKLILQPQVFLAYPIQPDGFNRYLQRNVFRGESQGDSSEINFLTKAIT
jgi:hypothetical protein